MQQYLLARTAYFCIEESRVVFLDLHKDKYIGLAPDQTDRFHVLLNGSECFDESSRQLASTLVDQGLLTLDSSAGRVAVPTTIARARCSLGDREPRVGPAIALSHLWHGLRAFMTAKKLLRTKSLEQIILGIQERKRRMQPVVSFDLRAAQDAMAVLRIVRPFLYATANRCLFDSLVVVEFMARYGLFPTWVFAVKSSPFAAHCWVQYGEFVCNDAPGRTNQYQPIMTV